MTEDNFLTVAQVAERMQVVQATVRRWLRSGQLRGVQVGGARWRIPEAELRRLQRGEDRQ